MNDENDKDLLTIKTVLIGDSGVGKTSIINQFTKNEFDSEIEASISSQYNSKIINIKEIEKEIKFDIWDTAGQEIYRSLAKIFYKDSKIIILVYDITNKKSFDGIKQYWYKQVSSISNNTHPILALVGNKSDLYNNQDVNDEEALKYAESIGAIFQKISAKSNNGIDTLFKNVGRKFLIQILIIKKKKIKKKNYIILEK